MKRRLYVVCLFTCVLLAVFSLAQAASVKERMERRLPVLTQLKDKGVLGENNRGFLEYRVAQRPQLNLVNDENNDRRQVYESIAKKQGASVDRVGKRRARMLLEHGKPGQWFQRENGNWFQK